MAHWMSVLMAVDVVIALLAVLLVKRVWRAASRAKGAAEPAQWPAVTVIVPVTGIRTGTGECLQSLLVQDYPDYEVIFVTASADDAAVPAIRELMTQKPVATGAKRRHVVSGQATVCSQKNHSLLGAVKEMCDSTQVIVFCDSSHIARTDWLSLLVAPVANGETPVTTGYHHVIPKDRRPGTLGRAATVLALYVMHRVPRLSQPWGGNTAVNRKLFENMDIEGLWAKSVVDDVSLAGLLKTALIRVGTLSAAELSTPVCGETVAGWCDWLTRQLFYLRLYFPVPWAVGGAVLCFIATRLLLAGTLCVLFPIGTASAWAFCWSVVFAVSFAWFAAMTRTLHPEPGSPVRWVLTCGAAVFVALWCHVRTWFAREVRWRGAVYRVDGHGTVLNIRRE